MRSKNTAYYSQIVAYVNSYFDNFGRSPSTREIERATSISRPTVQRYLRELAERGELSYDGHRGIVTSYMQAATGSTQAVPIGPSIPCGALNDVADTSLESVRLPIALTGQGEFFLLRARGCSMINAGIDDGDLVLIRRCCRVRPGRIAAFLYDGTETTLKRYEHDADAIYLVPENDAMQPIVIRGADRAKLQIQGEAVKVLKDL